MNILVALRVIAGLAVIAVGVWLFVLALPALSFQILALSLVAGVFIIEAPRFRNVFRQRQERLAIYVEENASAEKLMNRANSFQRWSWICYVAAIALIFVGFKMFGHQGFTVTLGVSFALMAVGFALGLYRVFARTSVDFRSLNAAKPSISPRKMWIITGGLMAVIILALVAERVWHVPAMNWFYGALAISLIGAVTWRWLRGWPKESDPP
ncbi:MAG TPA: hypothetical protein VM915_10640 [Verrucomicrobiae bacterium]|nr:hypothetical protein [Verrucomicrobiae bacterium]